MMKRLSILIGLMAISVLAAACSGGSDAETATATATSSSAGPAGTGTGAGPDGSLPTVAPEDSLRAAIESISGFDVTDVTISEEAVTLKYDQVVNEPSELLLMRWMDFASVAASFVEEPSGDIVLVPQVEGANIASIRFRAVDVVDYLDGKRPLEDVLASIEIE